MLARRFDDLGRGQADAFVDHVHAGVARAHRDLLGAVGMAVEAGLADQEFQPPAELARHAVDVGAQVVEAHGLVARRAADAGRRAILAEAFTQREAPFAGGDAGFGAGDRGRHDVAVLLRGRAQLLQRRRDRLLIARGAPGLEPLDLLGLGLRRHGEDGVGSAGERRRLALDEAVDADHGLLAALDRLDPARVRFDQLLLHVALLDRDDGAAHRFDVRELLLAPRA